MPAALYHASKVISVEVEPSNYAELLKNIQINRINSYKIEAVLLGISTKYANKLNKLYLTADEIRLSEPIILFLRGSKMFTAQR